MGENISSKKDSLSRKEWSLCSPCTLKELIYLDEEMGRFNLNGKKFLELTNRYRYRCGGDESDNNGRRHKSDQHAQLKQAKNQQYNTGEEAKKYCQFWQRG